MSVLSDRVAFTASQLDRHFPGWEDKIDLSTLSMVSGCACVGGQLEKAFGTTERGLFGTDSSAYERFARRLVGRMSKRARRLAGLPTDTLSVSFEECELLAFGIQGKTAWTKEIRARRAAKAAA